MKKLSIVLGLLLQSFSLLAATQGTMTRAFDTVVALLLARPDDANTLSACAGQFTKDDNLGGIIQWDSTSTAATNATTIFQVAGRDTGRYFRRTWNSANTGTTIIINNSVVMVVDNIATMQALDVTKGTGVVMTRGYFTPGDGWGNQYWYDGLSSELPDGGTIHAPNNGPGRWKLLLFSPFNGLQAGWFGGISDGSLALAQTYCDNHNGGTIVVAPAGAYDLTTPFDLHDNTTLQMETGAVLTSDGTVSNLVQVIGRTNVAIVDCSLASATNGIYVYASTNVKIFRTVVATCENGFLLISNEKVRMEDDAFNNCTTDINRTGKTWVEFNDGLIIPQGVWVGPNALAAWPADGKEGFIAYHDSTAGDDPVLFTFTEVLESNGYLFSAGTSLYGDFSATDPVVLGVTVSGNDLSAGNQVLLTANTNRAFIEFILDPVDTVAGLGVDLSLTASLGDPNGQAQLPHEPGSLALDNSGKLWQNTGGTINDWVQVGGGVITSAAATLVAGKDGTGHITTASTTGLVPTFAGITLNGTASINTGTLALDGADAILVSRWNAVGTTFTGMFKLSLTDTAHAAGSQMVRYQVNSADVFTMDAAGNSAQVGTLHMTNSGASLDLSSAGINTVGGMTFQFAGSDVLTFDAATRLYPATDNTFKLGNGTKGFLQVLSYLFQGPNASGANTAGNDVNLNAGPGTGTGAQGTVRVNSSSKTGSGSGVQNVNQARVTVAGPHTTLTESSATTFCDLALVGSGSYGGFLIATVMANDGSAYQSTTYSVPLDVVNNAGTLTGSFGTAVANSSPAANSGTLTATFSISFASTTAHLQCNAVSSLSQTTLEVSYQLFMNGTAQITSTPQ